MSDSEGSYYQTPPTIEPKSKTGRKATENNRKRTSKSTRPSKITTSDSDIFGISQGHETGAEVGEGSSDRACLSSLFVTHGEYYIDCKVYRANDARNTDSLELWKKAIVRIKLQADIDSLQWQKLQEFVRSADVLFPNKPMFNDK